MKRFALRVLSLALLLGVANFARGQQSVLPAQNPGLVLSGTGGALTNYTLQATDPEPFINGFTNVCVNAVMQFDPNAAFVYYSTLTITNGSGTTRTIRWLEATNRFHFFSANYGTNEINTMTNNTQWQCSLRVVGSNVFVFGKSFVWP